MAEQLVTLCFIVRDGQVLLIRKKRGIGAGKINGPGGKVDPGESPLAGAIREVQEEIGVTPLDPVLHGQVRFLFTDGLVFHCMIYLARRYEGEPCETDEAVPLWFPVDSVPYEEMWADDKHWLPALLEARQFTGTVGVDGEAVTSHSFQFS